MNWDFFAGWIGGAIFATFITPWLLNKWIEQELRYMNWTCLLLCHRWRLLWDKDDWDRAYLRPHELVTFVERCERCGRRRFIPPPYLRTYKEPLKGDP